MLQYLEQRHRIEAERIKQKHEIETSRTQQTHQITTAYLDRSLNPEIPIAIRQQYLRFLATPHEDRDQLRSWAKAELDRVSAYVEGLDRSVDEAHREVAEAKDEHSLARAERRLRTAVESKAHALGAPRKPPVSAAALRAGFFGDCLIDIGPILMAGENLRGTRLLYSKLPGSDFDGADLRNATFQGVDARGSTFKRAVCIGASFFGADLRACDFAGADLTDANLKQARFEGADLTDATLADANVQCIYDERTVWPNGFDPVVAGAILAPSRDPTGSRPSAAPPSLEPDAGDSDTRSPLANRP